MTDNYDYRIKIIHDFKEFLSLEKRWDDLLDSIEFPLLFSSHAWLRTWIEDSSKKNSLFILTIWDKDRLAGILPLERKTFRTCKILKFYGFHSLSDPRMCAAFNIICSVKEMDKIINTLKIYFRLNRSWGRIELNFVPYDFRTVEKLYNQFNDQHFIATIEPYNGSYYIDINGDFDTFFNKLGSNFRRKIRVRNKRVAELGEIKFEVLTTFDIKELNRFYKVEDTGWKHDNGQPIKKSEDLLVFYNKIAEIFSSNHQFILANLLIDNQLIASEYAIVFNNVLYLIKIGVNYSYPGSKELSFGHLIIYHLIKYAFDNYINKIDFYGPIYEYESHWTKAINQKYTINIFNSHNSIALIYLFIKFLKNFYRNIIGRF
ncbi:MAG: GNAT family N-acetyltransferase [Spirochaetes bacterium]|nr:GNAT family N-acetyltransferase [Spirochaetota bacterium]